MKNTPRLLIVSAPVSSRRRLTVCALGIVASLCILNTSNADSLTWTGEESTLWDTLSQNWKDATGAAAKFANDDTVIFDASVTDSAKRVITIQSDGVTLRSMTIIGARDYTVANGSHITVASGGQLTNTDATGQVTFSGNSSEYGGAIFSFGSIALANVTFSGNSSGTSGGAIYNDHGSITLSNALFLNNSANFTGGALFAMMTSRRRRKIVSEFKS